MEIRNRCPHCPERAAGSEQRGVLDTSSAPRAAVICNGMLLGMIAWPVLFMIGFGIAWLIN